VAYGEKSRQALAVTSGYTDLKNYIFVGELIAISERLRLTLIGSDSVFLFHFFI
jgi:hypothetical protein